MAGEVGVHRVDTVMSKTTTLVRLSRMACSSWSVSRRARVESSTPMIGTISKRSRTWRTGVGISRMASCWIRMVRTRWKMYVSMAKPMSKKTSFMSDRKVVSVRSESLLYSARRRAATARS
jgi:hypothetical protein